jgi:tetratricopeptide (TPR) repeat protein
LPHVGQSLSVPSEAPRGVRLDDPAAVRRLQSTIEELGAAAAYRAAKRYDWAAASLQRVLDLDPSNAEALAMQAQLAADPIPLLTPEELEARQREIQIVDLLGAAASHIEASHVGPAVSYLREILRLDPNHAAAKSTLASLGFGQ